MELIPKEKAKELLKRFESVSKPFMKESEVQVYIHPEHAKQCALICVDELIEALEHNSWQNKDCINHYKEVKKEIEEL